MSQWQNREETDSFESFRIAVIWILWVTVLIIASDVCRMNRRISLFGKRFRSKAFSAACLFPGQLIRPGRIGFILLSTPFYDTVSKADGLQLCCGVLHRRIGDLKIGEW